MGKERKNILKRSLRGKMLLLAVLPVVFLAILLGFVSTRSFTSAMLGEVKNDMANQCHMIADIYDRMYPGAFNLEVLDESSYNLYKGQVDITNACQIIDSIHDAYNVEVSIFRSDSVRGDDHEGCFRRPPDTDESLSRRCFRRAGNRRGTVLLRCDLKW